MDHSIGDHKATVSGYITPIYPGDYQRRVQIVAAHQTDAPGRALSIAHQDHRELMELRAHPAFDVMLMTIDPEDPDHWLIKYERTIPKL